MRDPCSDGSVRSVVLFCAVFGLVLPTGLSGFQTAPARSQSTAWNGARALELIDRARDRRQLPLADTALHDYRAEARGMVYFYLDPRDEDERILVKTDQIALEVFWAQPDRAKQRIVGLRAESNLPNRMYYHLDHLTVVQNGFGDLIRLGDGDEVHDVPHPAAPGADTIYDYRLVDSLTIRLPGRPEPVRAYELHVRPRRSDRSALVGSVFVDRETADIVRMTFTFTPASYVDPRLDYINISLDNSLWDGSYWLPYEQAVEIRRQIPELDYAAGAVILGRFRVTEYAFNQGLPDSLFHGYPVVSVPRAQREAFPFEAGLYEDLRQHGLAPPPELRAIRRAAPELVGQEELSGLPRWRLAISDPSALFRYNRAEGIFLGGGLAHVPGPQQRFQLDAGYAFSAERPVLRLRGRTSLASVTTGTAELHLNRLRDIGVRPGLPGALNSATAAFGDDYIDPYFASGGSATVTAAFAGPWSVDLGLTAEKHRSARLEVLEPVFADSGSFRPVRAVQPGTMVSLTARLERTGPAPGGVGWGGIASAEAGTFEGEPFFRPLVDAHVVRRTLDHSADLRLSAMVGASLGAPAHRLFLFGGRNSLPGYGYRDYVGDVFAIAEAHASRDLWRPWLRLRLIAAAGWSDLAWFDDPPADPAASAISPLRDWDTATTGGVLPALGAGFGIFYDILRVDAVRGLDGGRWQFLLSINPDLWSIL